MIHLKTKEEIAKVRRAALMVSRTLGMLASEVKPGVTTLQLDKLAEEFVLDHGAKPSFKGLYGFPNACCISVGRRWYTGSPTRSPCAKATSFPSISEPKWTDTTATTPIPLPSGKSTLAWPNC